MLTVPTYPKLGREVRAVCHNILTARNPAALNTEKRKLLEMAGSVERLYDIIRYYKVCMSYSCWWCCGVDGRSKMQICSTFWAYPVRQIGTM